MKALVCLHFLMTYKVTSSAPVSSQADCTPMRCCIILIIVLLLFLPTLVFHVLFADFLLCFVCQRLFSTDAKDLEKASLDEAVESLQQILSDHLRASHQITLTTGYESPPLSYSVSDKEDGKLN